MKLQKYYMYKRSCFNSNKMELGVTGVKDKSNSPEEKANTREMDRVVKEKRK